MNGRTASLLLVLCLPALLSATCNPKKRAPDRSEEETAFEASRTLEGSQASGDPGTVVAKPCPAPRGAARPLGPLVAPSCPGAASGADPGLAQAIEEGAASLAPGLAPVGPPFGVRAGPEPGFARSVVLQGPPHCYVIVALCDEGAVPSVHIAGSGTPGHTVTGKGPAARFCPETTASVDVALSVAQGPHDCAARIYGD
jgi:hypothetical protein